MRIENGIKYRKIEVVRSGSWKDKRYVSVNLITICISVDTLVRKD